MLAVCVGIFISGGFVAKLGRYYPFLIIGLVMPWPERPERLLTIV